MGACSPGCVRGLGPRKKTEASIASMKGPQPKHSRLVLVLKTSRLEGPASLVCSNPHRPRVCAPCTQNPYTTNRWLAFFAPLRKHIRASVYSPLKLALLTGHKCRHRLVSTARLNLCVRALPLPALFAFEFGRRRTYRCFVYIGARFVAIFFDCFFSSFSRFLILHLDARHPDQLCRQNAPAAHFSAQPFATTKIRPQ